MVTDLHAAWVENSAGRNKLSGGRSFLRVTPAVRVSAGEGYSRATVLVSPKATLEEVARAYQAKLGCSRDPVKVRLSPVNLAPDSSESLLQKPTKASTASTAGNRAELDGGEEFMILATVFSIGVSSW